MTPYKKIERKKRAQNLISALRKSYPKAGMILQYSNNWELLVAVVLSAQCTDKKVNEVTSKLFKKYKILESYVSADPEEFEQDIFQTGFYRNKTKNILAAARAVKEKFNGTVPDTMDELLTIPGVARKTANVVLGNAFNKSEGIAVDTHVRRFSIRFDLSDYTDPMRIERDLMQVIPKAEWYAVTYLVIEYGRAVRSEKPDDPLLAVYPKAAKRWALAR